MTMQSTRKPRTTVLTTLSRLAAFGALALSTCSIVQASGQPISRMALEEHFTPIPGSMEWSGRLIVRPIRIEELVERGLSGHEIDRVRSRAFRQLDSILVEFREPTDELIVRVPDGMTDLDAAWRILETGDYEYVEPDWLVYPLDCPNDSRFDEQWHHVNMQSCDGWDIETGDLSIAVGVCDTGVRTTHEDLKDQRLPGYNAVDRRTEQDGGQINDINGHGTATTGCAAATGNNAVGVTGTAWRVSHRMIRVTNRSDGSAFLSDLTHGALWAVQNGCKVASVSYSGVGSYSVETTGQVIMDDYGGVLVWAAGNEGRRMSSTIHEHVVVVGATDSKDEKTSWSNFGEIIDVTAPGSAVYTTLNSSNSGYGAVSGTSFSCPLTAGLAALIFSHDPDLSPYRVVDCIKFGADDLGDPYPDEIFGWGRINVHRSLQLVDSFFLDVRPRGEMLNSGEILGFVGFMAEPKVTTGLFYSTTGLGSTFIKSLGVDVDLDRARPIGRLKESRDDGIVTWQIRIPPITSPVDVTFQMAQSTGYKSLTVERRIEP